MTKFMLSLAAALFCVLPVSAEETSRYIIVKDVNISSDESDLEASKSNAIEQGKRTAFSRVAEMIYKKPNGNINISDQQLDECIEGYSVKNEKFINNSYQAVADYRMNLSTVANVLNERRKVANLIKSNKGKKVISIRSNDVIALYKKVCDIAEQNSIQCAPYSFSNKYIKFVYSEELAKLIRKANIGAIYESTD